jgi:hypothetical protein
MTARDHALDLSRVGHAVLSGIYRLESPEAYDAAFASVAQAFATGTGPYTIDLRQVVLMNSSGIRALASLVQQARERKRQIVLLGRSAVPWQNKSIPSLAALWDGVQAVLHEEAARDNGRI